jgi:hypothetical protein
MASESLNVMKEEQTKEEMDLNCKAIQNMNREKKINNLFIYSLQFDKKIAWRQN